MQESIPEISLTLNKDPESESVTENSSPWEPWTVNMGCVEPDPTTVRIVPDTAVLKEPEIRVCPATCREPVNVLTSVEAFPIFTPVFVTWNSIRLPVITVKEPVTTEEPVTIKLPVISNMSVFKVKGVPEPDITKEPEIVSVPINVLLPVVAKLLVLLFKELVYASNVPTLVFNEDVVE